MAGRTMMRWAAAAGLALALSVGSAGAQTKDVVVFAAASMKNALDAIAGQYQAETGKKVVSSYAASSALAKQIEDGAPADIFISADLDWMDAVAKKNLVREGTRVNLLGNRIVLVAEKGKAKPVDIKPGFDLAALLGGGKLAMGEVNAVPAGKYGKAALEKLGAWSGVMGNIAQAESVRAALLLVSRGEAPYGIVYATDAAADKNVEIVGTFPTDSHPPIIYPVAILAASKNPDAEAFFAYLTSGKAKPAFEQQGFSVLR